MADGNDYLEAFEACRLGPGEFRHQDHVRVAWLMLREGSLEDTLVRFSRSLRRFADHVGASDLYHQTITWTYLFVIHERKTRMGEGHGWEAFREANPDLFEDHRAFLGRYYTDEILKSELARRSYVLPNRSAASPSA